MSAVALTLHALILDESGATAVEYALLSSVVAIAAIAGLLAFGQSAKDLWLFVAGTVTAAIG